MNLLFSKRNRTPSETAEEVIDIDVTPVMNMFIILIPFLVSMAVFTQMAIIDFSLPPNVGTGLDTSKGKPKLKITVVINKEYCAVTHGERMLDSIPCIGEEYNYEKLGTQIALRRKEVDIKDELVEKGIKAIDGRLEKFFVAKGKITADDKTAIMGRISGSSNIEEAVKDCDFVIEAVLEVLSIKREIFEKLDASAPEGVVLASNTSTLNITDI